MPGRLSTGRRDRLEAGAVAGHPREGRRARVRARRGAQRDLSLQGFSLVIVIKYQISKIVVTNIIANVLHFLRARSRLYRSRFLQENMSFAARFNLYLICAILHRFNFNMLAKN